MPCYADSCVAESYQPVVLVGGLAQTVALQEQRHIVVLALTQESADSGADVGLVLRVALD